VFLLIFCGRLFDRLLCLESGDLIGGFILLLGEGAPALRDGDVGGESSSIDDPNDGSGAPSASSFPKVMVKQVLALLSQLSQSIQQRSAEVLVSKKDDTGSNNGLLCSRKIEIILPKKCAAKSALARFPNAYNEH
jgi:hypothetical protein